MSFFKFIFLNYDATLRQSNYLRNKDDLARLQYRQRAFGGVLPARERERIRPALALAVEVHAAEKEIISVYSRLKTG